MWPWAKRRDDPESVPGRLITGLLAGAREMVVAPADPAARRFGRSLDLLERDAKKGLDTDGLRELGTDAEKTMKAFGKEQKDSVDRMVGDLDLSLRDLLGVLEEAIGKGEDFCDSASRSTGRLAEAMERAGLDELRSAVRAEVGDLIAAVRQQRESMKRLSEVYETELLVMRERLVRAQSAARTDALTKLPNGVSFAFYLQLTVERAKEGGAACLGMIDLDGFKALNDEQGHMAGDAALTEFAGRLVKVVGKKGFVARLGGDEFGVVYSGKSADLERLLGPLRDGLKARPCVFEDRPLRFSMSFGVVPVDGTFSAEEVRQEADSKMYEEKRGRQGKRSA